MPTKGVKKKTRHDTGVHGEPDQSVSQYIPGKSVDRFSSHLAQVSADQPDNVSMAGCLRINPLAG